MNFRKYFSFSTEKKQEYTGYPTKEEFEKKVIQIQEGELNSDQFKRTKEFVSQLNGRENLKLEKKLFKIVGTYGLEDHLINKSYDDKKISKTKRYNELKNFMNSLTLEQIHSNLYLEATANFMETSVKDCEMIIEHLKNQIKDLEISDENRRIEINIDIPEERLPLFPRRINEQTAIPYYRPQAYKTEYVYLLDEENRHIYEEYNQFVRNIEKLAEDIYHLQMWNLLFALPKQINNYYFTILNNNLEHQFVTSYFVKKCRTVVVEEKIQLYQLGEETKNNISRIVGLPSEEIVRMSSEDLGKHIKQKLGIETSEEMDNRGKAYFKKKSKV